MRLIFSFFAAGIALGVFAACDSTVTPSGAGGGSTSAGPGTGAGGATASSSVGTGAGTASSGATTSSSTGAGGGSSCVVPPDPKVFELGTGETCFERLTPLETLTVQQGPQGGFHLWLAVGCADCNAQMALEYGVKDPATHDWYSGTYALKEIVAFTGGSWGEHAGSTAFLPGVFFQPMSVLPKGTHVLLSATILDKNMMPLHAEETEVVLGDTVIWNPPCDPNPGCGAPGGLPCCSDSFGDAGPADAGMD